MSCFTYVVTKISKFFTIVFDALKFVFDALDGEFWAAIAGALVGGIISYFLQRATLRQAREGHARALFFKVTKIKSHLMNLKNYLNKGVEEADSKKWSYWQTVRPLANLPDKVVFSADEMSILLFLKDIKLFNEVMPLEDIYNSTLDVFLTMRTSRNELASLLPAEEMNGIQGTTEITRELMKKAGPKMAEVDDLVRQLHANLKRDVNDVSAALDKMSGLFNRELKLGLTVKDVL